MSGTNGISSLQKALGSLNLADTKQVKPATAAENILAGRTTGASVQAYDKANVSAGGLAAQATSDGDVRLDKVAALRAQIAAGTYQVPAGAVADKVIESLLSGS